ncbi:MAG: hypothetical protein RIF33_05505 [Cyclobacteriaceae bacterium]
MKVEEVNGEIVVRIPASVGNENVQNLLDYIDYLENRGEVAANQVEIDDLANEVNRSMWDKFQQRRAEK